MPFCHVGVIYLNITATENRKVSLSNRLFTPAIEKKTKAGCHKALWEINDKSWPPYLLLVSFSSLYTKVDLFLCVCECVRARVHVMDVITLKLDKSAQLLFTVVAYWPQSGSLQGLLFGTIL